MSEELPKVYGDLGKAGQLLSVGTDSAGGTTGQMSAEFSIPFLSHLTKPSFDPALLPQGLPAMSVESYRDTREGPIWKRTFRLVSKDFPEPTNPEDKPRDQNNPIYGLQVTLEDIPLALHPDIDNLIINWGGVAQADGTVEFPRLLSAENYGNVGSLIIDDGKKTNPMWGQKTYKAVSMVFTAKWFWTGTDDTPWPSQIDKVGQIDTPQKAPDVSKQTRDWLYLGMSTRMTGRMHEIEESWLMSAPGGWFKDVYGAEALKGSA